MRTMEFKKMKLVLQEFEDHQKLEFIKVWRLEASVC